MEDKKTSVHDFLTNIASLFGLLFVFALILLPFASGGFIADGYPTVGRVLLGTLWNSFFPKGALLLYIKKIREEPI